MQIWHFIDVNLKLIDIFRGFLSVSLDLSVGSNFYFLVQKLLYPRVGEATKTIDLEGKICFYVDYVLIQSRII